MSTRRGVAHLLVTAVAAVTTIGSVGLGATAASATPVVSTPAANAVWYAGETKTITWTADTQTGAYTLQLWTTAATPAKLATIGTGADVTVGTYKWSIPASMTTLVAEDLVVKVVPATGDTITSSSFDLRKPYIGGIHACWGDYLDIVPAVCLPDFNVWSSFSGGGFWLYWGSAGPTGDLVKVDLVRTVDGVATDYPVMKSTPNDGKEYVTIPPKTPGDESWLSPTFTLRITPLLATANPGSTRTFANIAAYTTTLFVRLGGMSHSTSVAAGQKVGIEFGGLEKEGVTRHYLVTAKPVTGDPIVIHNGARPHEPEFTWRPPAAGEYTITITDADKPGKKVTMTDKITATASTEVVRQAAPSDTTATTGQPITLSWQFFDDASDTSANDSYLPVDVNLVNSSGKTVAKIAAGYEGYWDEPRDEFDLFRRWNDGKLIWRPAAKIAPGTYTIKVNRTGSTTTSDQTITIANPTSLTLADLTNTTVEAGEKVALDWTIDGDSEAPVDATLVSTADSTKTFSLAKKVTAGQATVTIPAAVAAGSYTVRVATNEKFGAAKTPFTATKSLTVVDPVLTTTTGAATVKNGATLTISWSYAHHSALPVKLELFAGSATKATLAIEKSAASYRDGGGGTYTWSVPAGLAVGADYTIKATVVGGKSGASDASPVFAVTAPSLTVTDAPFEGGIVYGATVPITWTSDSGVSQNVTVSLVKGTKVVAKLNAKEVTSNGTGTLNWLVPTKFAAGSDYKVRVTDNDVTTLTDDSAAFSIGPNPTTAG